MIRMFGECLWSSAQSRTVAYYTHFYLLDYNYIIPCSNWNVRAVIEKNCLLLANRQQCFGSVCPIRLGSTLRLKKPNTAVGFWWQTPRHFQLHYDWAFTVQALRPAQSSTHLVQRIRGPGCPASQDVYPMSVVCYLMPVPETQTCKKMFQSLSQNPHLPAVSLPLAFFPSVEQAKIVEWYSMFIAPPSLSLFATHQRLVILHSV